MQAPPISAVHGDADGTPHSARFGDIHPSASGGLAQARHLFLQGCGLPAAWQGQAQWRILETDFGLGLNFLAAWRAWKDDPQRPRLLHFVSVDAYPVNAQDLLQSAAAYPELQALAAQLATQWWGLAPGFHRLVFEEGRVLLTLCVGPVRPMLREHAPCAFDSVFLDGFDPHRNPDMGTLDTLKAVARLCRRGTGVAGWATARTVQRDLAQYGFVVGRSNGLAPEQHCIAGRYDPPWTLKRKPLPAPAVPARCVVIGAGLAGAAVAASLARRGWQVRVLDAADAPAAGASSLPAGLLVPTQSPDDNLLSRLTRSGVRATLQQCQQLLQPGQDWQLCGALERRLADPRPCPWDGTPGAVWSRTATPAEKAQAGLAPDATAWWHEQAAWIKPAALVRAWLAQDGIAWQGGARVHRLCRQGAPWQALDEAGQVLAEAELVVVAAALGSAALLDALLPTPLPVHPVRGQISWAPHTPGLDLPPWPLNGKGHLLPSVPLEGGPAWLAGSTYGPGDADAAPRAQDRLANQESLHALHPSLAARLAPAFLQGDVRDWSGVRCAAQDRRPLVGCVQEGLWLSTAMGSRGLSFAVLCAELLAAQLQGEPLAVPRGLGRAR